MYDWYWQNYSSLLEYKDDLEELLEKFEEIWLGDTETYKDLDELILDILDIQCYIDRAYEKLEKYKKLIKD